MARSTTKQHACKIFSYLFRLVELKLEWEIGLHDRSMPAADLYSPPPSRFCILLKSDDANWLKIYTFPVKVKLLITCCSLFSSSSHYARSSFILGSLNEEASDLNHQCGLVWMNEKKFQSWFQFIVRLLVLNSCPRSIVVLLINKNTTATSALVWDPNS